MHSYRFTVQAQEDLKDIHRYTVQEWGEQQAKDYLAALRDTLHMLLKMPGIGRSCAGDLQEGIYSYPYASHVIYYKLTEEALIVVAVLHNRMVPAAHLEERL